MQIMKKTIPQKLKTWGTGAALFLLTLPTFTACDKEEFDKQADIAAKTAKFRAAFGPAKTQPINIADAFDIDFRLIAQKNNNPMKTALDSANNTIPMVDYYLATYSANHPTLTALKNSANELIAAHNK
ncbi:MAG: hypothetical protein LBJ18_00195 [Rickettsiales bacterium]|jgi:hypothetical protein|nr:hypothetical protein [Rickettsiales bacterium]